MLLDLRSEPRPIVYGWAHTAWLKQQLLHWVHTEISMSDDIRDWKNLSEAQRAFFTHALLYFTQADTNIHNCYMKQYAQVFGAPEVSMMLTAFANMETVHVNAYSYLLESLGLADFTAFREFEEFQKKETFIENYVVKPDDPASLALALAAYGAFTEGFQLFSNFAVLMNPARRSVLQKTELIVSWSVRDETLHALSLIQLFKTLVDEYELETKALKEQLRECAFEAYINEIGFAKALYARGEYPGLTLEELENFLAYTMNVRCHQLGIKHVTGKPGKNLSWFADRIGNTANTNFFESDNTEYSKHRR